MKLLPTSPSPHPLSTYPPRFAKTGLAPPGTQPSAGPPLVELQSPETHTLNTYRTPPPRFNVGQGPVDGGAPLPLLHESDVDTSGGVSVQSVGQGVCRRLVHCLQVLSVLA